MKILLGAVLAAGLACLVSCSKMPEMDKDILASHILAQQAIYLDDKSAEYAKLVGNSFGISAREFRALQEHIVKKRKRTLLEVDAKIAMERYVKKLKGRRDGDSRKEYVTQLLVPFMQRKSGGEGFEGGLDGAIVKMFGQFFPAVPGALEELVASLERYHSGGYYSSDYLRSVNYALKEHGFFMLLELDRAANVLTIEDTIVAPLVYSGVEGISVLALRREVPGFLPPFKGYSTLGSEEVVVLLDLIDFTAEEVLAELKQGEAFETFTDPKLEISRRRLGIPVGTDESNAVYRTLLQKDFGNRSKKYVARALAMGTALHEAKHRIDNIELPEMTLNYDGETSAYLTAAMFSAAPRYELLSAIKHLEGYCYRHRERPLVETLKALWELAKQEARGELTEAALRSGLYETYLAYRTIREGYALPELEKFEDEIVPQCWRFFEGK